MIRLTSLPSVPRPLRKRTETPACFAARFPELSGAPVDIRFLRDPRNYRGQLVCETGRGQPVHAASDLRKREIICDVGLKKQPSELVRILIHEVFHFAWRRLGNPARTSWSALLRSEFARGARGELGWSAELRKQRFQGHNLPDGRRWSEYACESFCDTAAWLYSGLREHEEFTLAPRFRLARARWLRAHLSRGPLLI